jgi:GH15 family glucan-1,4-alpha-glucosidase
MGLEPNAVLRRNGGSTVVNGSPAIGDLALLGDTRTAALIDGNGRIVWLCPPHFDGETCFGALIAWAGGGQFRLGPIDPADVMDRRLSS